MSDAFRLTDEGIRDMLLERSGAAMPDDLRDAVLGAVREARTDGIRAARPRRSRTTFLLLAAAVTLGASIGIATLAGSRQTAPPPVTPVPQVPQATSALASPSATASATLTASCPAFDRSASNGGENTGREPIPGPAPAAPANGSVIVLGGDVTTDPEIVDPFATSPTPSPIADWGLESLSVNKWSPSLDGTVVAAELWQLDCPNEIFVARTDGTGLRRPFTAPGRDAYAPAWAPDGRYLAAVVAAHSPDADAASSALGSVAIWDPATGEVRDLGRPCERCQPVGAPNSFSGTLAWSPDGQWVAVDSADLACGEASSPPPGNFECRGIALVSPAGTWRAVSVPDDGQTTAITLVGWLDASTLLVARDGGMAKLDIDGGGITSLPITADQLLTPVSKSLSPDRTKLVSMVPGSPFLDVIDIATGRSSRLEPVPSDVLDVAWSADSKWIIVQADSDGLGANQGLYLARADGSEAPRRVLAGGFGVMAWLQAAEQ